MLSQPCTTSYYLDSGGHCDCIENACFIEASPFRSPCLLLNGLRLDNDILCTPADFSTFVSIFRTVRIRIRIGVLEESVITVIEMYVGLELQLELELGLGFLGGCFCCIRGDVRG